MKYKKSFEIAYWVLEIAKLIFEIWLRLNEKPEAHASLSLYHWIHREDRGRIFRFASAPWPRSCRRGRRRCPGRTGHIALAAGSRSSRPIICPSWRT